MSNEEHKRELIDLENVREKKKLLENLNREYIELFERKEELISKEKVAIEAKYLSYFGGLLKRKIELNIEFRSLKYRLTLMMNYINKDQEIDEKEINKKIDEGLKEYYKELKNFKYKMAFSKDLMESPTVTKEELAEIKNIFRQLAKRLHPDMVGDLDAEKRLLWEKTLLAYESNDLLTLEVLKDIVLNELHVNDDIHIKGIDEKIKDISQKINELKEFIDKVKSEFSFDILDKLNDIDFINNKNKELNLEIKELKEKIEFLKTKLENILEKERG